MIYKDYIGFTKTYVVVHNTGFGVMEANYIEKEVVFETNYIDEAYSKSIEFRNKNNTEEEIKSSWIPNTYWVNVNTLNIEGQKLYKILRNEVEEKIKLAKESGNYKKYNFDGNSILMQHNKKFDDNKITGKPMCDMIWIHPTG